jgi:cytochrome c oxidase cbb3-type subunit III
VSFGPSAASLFIASALLFLACGPLPGRPSPVNAPERPSEIADFAKLYSQNCAGCHGADGHFGGALPLNNPAYLAIVNDASVRDAIATGITGTSMPAFATESGGTLTGEQINIIVSGIRSGWGAKVERTKDSPPYLSPEVGNASNGSKLFGLYCASCHGGNETGGTAGAVTDESFLALYSDQSLRTLIIAGRPDFGHPGWNGYPNQAPLGSAQVSDLVAWLSAQRGS